MIPSKHIKELREATGIGFADCKAALEEAAGDMQKARALLAGRAGAAAQKKAGRALGAGVVASYIHGGGAVGALVRLSCETDFVARNEEFAALARDIAMHAAAMRPAVVDELLTQPFIKDETKTIGDIISAATQKFGERAAVEELAVFSARA